MDRSTFAALVEKVEAHARANPRTYLLRLLALTAMGYAYIVAVLLAMVALIAVLMLILLIFDLGRWNLFGMVVRWTMQALIFGIVVTIFYTIKGMFARIPAPDGYKLTRKQAPALFAAIEEARKAARGPRIHRVLLTDDFNAAVMQRPLLGPLGWYRNELLIGLPLLDALTPDEMRAVLAHELGHLSSGHGRFAARILTVRRTWIYLMDAMSESFVLFLFTGFVQKYAPRFEAYSLVMARDQEREADQIAARLAGSRALADALIKLEVQGAYMQQTFCLELARRADHSPEPPAAFFDELRAGLNAELSDEDARIRLVAALAADADPTQTHPSLAARLAAINESPRVPPAAALTAADELLSEEQAPLRAMMNAAWQAETRSTWEYLHEETKQQAARLSELDTASESRALSLREQWERADLTAQVHGGQWAIPRYRQLVRAAPHNAHARRVLAGALLAEGDEAGLEIADRALEMSPSAYDEVQALVEPFLLRRARLDELEAYRTRCREIRDKVETEGCGFSDWKPDHQYLAHGLSEDAVALLQERLATCPHLERAHLARWVWPAFPDLTVYILALKPNQGTLFKPEACEDIAGHMYRAPEFPGTTSVYISWRGKTEVDKVLAGVEGALIFERGKTMSQDQRQPRKVA